MERARKMILVPEPPPETSQSKVKEVEEMERNTDEKTLQTPGDHFSRLDSEMYEVLRSKAARDDYEKCVNYPQILRRYLFFCDNERSEVSEEHPEIDDIEETFAPLSEEAILAGVPKIHARKARLLLRHWEVTVPERLKWDNTGTITIDGRIVPRSNITDLIIDALNKNSQDEAPAGRMEFAKFLNTSETPGNLINNPKVLKIGQILTNSQHTAKRRLPASIELESQTSPIQTRSKKQAKKSGFHSICKKKKWSTKNNTTA